MISVSNGWKAAQNETLLPEMFVEITYEITEPGLQEKAVATGSNPEDFSNVAQVVSKVNKNSEKYATLDYGCWARFSLFPEELWFHLRYDHNDHDRY